MMLLEFLKNKGKQQKNKAAHLQSKWKVVFLLAHAHKPRKENILSFLLFKKYLWALL